MDQLLIWGAELSEALAKSLRAAAIAEDLGPKLQPMGWAAGATLFCIAALKQMWRWLTRTDSKVREEMRAAQRACETAQNTLKDTEKRVDELRLYDPEVFRKELAKAQDGGVLGKPAEVAEAWLARLEPDLARAYLARAEEVLANAPDRVGAEEARRLAQGAYAADPQLPAIAQTLSAADDLAGFWRRARLSDEERAAWDLAAQGDPVSAVKAGQQMLAAGSYGIARILLKRGWDRLRQADGAEARNTLAAKHEYARCSGALGQHAKAMALLQEVWEVRRRPDVLGEEHPETLNTAVLIACQDGLANDPAKALAACDKAASAEAAVLGPDNPLPLRRRAQRAHLQALAGDQEGAGAEVAEVRAAMLKWVAPTDQLLREIEQWTTDLGVTLPE